MGTIDTFLQERLSVAARFNQMMEDKGIYEPTEQNSCGDNVKYGIKLTGLK